MPPDINAFLNTADQRPQNSKPNNKSREKNEKIEKVQGLILNQSKLLLFSFALPPNFFKAVNFLQGWLLKRRNNW